MSRNSAVAGRHGPLAERCSSKRCRPILSRGFARSTWLVQEMYGCDRTSSTNAETSSPISARR